MTDRADYDPDWERRWIRAHERVTSLAPGAPVVETRAALAAMYQAHDAQFATVEALAAFRFDSLKKSAFADGYLLAMRSLGPEETVDEVWRSAVAQITAAKRAASRPDLGQPEGLAAFGSMLRHGTTRCVGLVRTITPTGREQAWAAVIEQRGRRADVCLVQIEPGRGAYGGFAGLATLAYRQQLALFKWRFWAGCSPQRISFYSYTPWGMHESGSEMFAARALTWRQGRYVEDQEGRQSFASVPAVLARLDPATATPHILIPVGARTVELSS